MKVLPVLHIQNGRAVPSFGAAGEDADPHALASLLSDRGCTRMALLDVDAACGRGHNRELVARLARHFRKLQPRACIQVGGGVRSSDQAQFFLDAGATWLMVGTVLHRYPAVVDQLLARFGEHLSASIDASEGQVHASGWAESLGQCAEDAAQRLGQRGFRRLVFIDIPRSASPAPDFATARRVCSRARVPVFMGGSLRDRGHIRAAQDIRELLGVMVDAFRLLEMPDFPDLAQQGC